MARVEIRLPDKFTFSTEVPIRVGDINRGQHVGHVAILSIIEEARARFWMSCDYSKEERDETGIGFIIADLAVVYLKQSGYGPPLRVELAVTDFSRKGYDIVYKVSDSAAEVEIARAKTGVVVFDYGRQEPIPVSAELKDKLSRNYLR
jgi:acyl-CoA thioester hydrolase